MLLKEVFQRVLINSGQFLIPSEKLELKIDPFYLLAAQILKEYSQYSPVVRRQNVFIEGSRQYTFTDANTPNGVPEWLSDIIPVRISGVAPYYFRDADYAKTTSPYLMSKQEFPYKYVKPVLTVPIDGQYEVELVTHHKIIALAGTETQDYDCPTVDDLAEEFFAMLTGRFLMALGRSRNAFTLSDIEITTDSADMIQEGKEMYKDAKEALAENKSKWYLAWV